MNLLIAILQVIISFTLAVFVFRWDFITDMKTQLGTKTLNHTKEAWQRIAAMTPSVIISAIPLDSLWYCILTSIMFGSIYWFMFDGLWQVKVVKGSFFDVSSTGKAKLDRLQRWLGWKLSALLKISIILLSTFFYFKTLLQ